MKKKNFYFWTLLAAALFTSVSLFTSCGDDEEEDDIVPPVPAGQYPAVPPGKITGDALKLVGSWTEEFMHDGGVTEVLSIDNISHEVFATFKKDGTFTDEVIKKTTPAGTSVGTWSYDAKEQIVTMTWNVYIANKPYVMMIQQQYKIHWTESDKVIAIDGFRISANKPCESYQSWEDEWRVFLRWPNSPTK